MEVGFGAVLAARPDVATKSGASPSPPPPHKHTPSQHKRSLYAEHLEDMNFRKTIKHRVPLSFSQFSFNIFGTNNQSKILRLKLFVLFYVEQASSFLFLSELSIHSWGCPKLSFALPASGQKLSQLKKIKITPQYSVKLLSTMIILFIFFNALLETTSKQITYSYVNWDCSMVSNMDF